ncbi:MAG: ATP-binding cassette domain-containing protein [Gemmataceae bacterium]
MIGFEDVRVRAGDFELRDIRFEVGAGAYAVLMGRTGSGKTTILETLCGLRRVAAGRVLLAGRDVTKLKPAERGVGYAPQDRALFQTMTVWENLAFALSIRRRPLEEMRRRVEELADWLGITSLLYRRPRGLSGGEAQRVNLGRALSFQPTVLLLDEPLSALDRETKGEMIELLRRMRERTNVTTLHVTHDSEEARLLADRVLEIRDGQVTTR